MVANVGDLPWVVVIALIVLVGGSQLPKIARNVGLAGKEFRKAQTEAEEEAEREAKAKESAATPAIAIAPTAAPVTAVATAAPTAAAEPSITLTPSQLDALLKAREDQVRTDETSN